MPVNPMQRRIKNSFLLGFLLALIIMALVVVGLIFKMKGIEAEKTELMSKQKKVYVAAQALESGESITMESFVEQEVQTTVNTVDIVSQDDFCFYNENGDIEIKYNKDGSERQKEMIMKVSVPAGTIVTKDMITEYASDISDDVREQEFNMIALPSELETGDYIDIRYSLPEGQDYIVLSKKKVLKATQTGIWLNLSEEEILTMNNAIVDSYTVAGSKLYALPYIEPGLQTAAVPTYPVSGRVLELISYNPNIVQEAKEALVSRYYANELAAANQRTLYIDPAVNANSAGLGENVEAKNQEEISKIQAAREAYVSSLGE